MLFGKKKDNPTENEYIDDVTYIQDMKKFPCGPWMQYDVLLAARGYGWVDMINWADYMATADLSDVSQVTMSVLAGMEGEDITKSYKNNQCKCAGLAELAEEKGVLSIAGISGAVKAPVKIVWFNQTRILRLFTIIDDELLMQKYVETVIRRTFGTKDAMKLAKPLPKEQ